MKTPQGVEIASLGPHSVRTPMKITKTFEIYIPDDCDNPRVHDSFVSHELELSLISFVNRVLDENLPSIEYAESTRFAIAMRILGSFQSRVDHEICRQVLQEILAARSVKQHI